MENSNCKVLCTQQWHCDRQCLPLLQSLDVVQCIPLHQGYCQPGRCPADRLTALQGLTVKAQYLSAHWLTQAPQQLLAQLPTKGGRHKHLAAIVAWLCKKNNKGSNEFTSSHCTVLCMTYHLLDFPSTSANLFICLSLFPLVHQSRPFMWFIHQQGLDP